MLLLLLKLLCLRVLQQFPTKLVHPLVWLGVLRQFPANLLQICFGSQYYNNIQRYPNIQSVATISDEATTTIPQVTVPASTEAVAISTLAQKTLRVSDTGVGTKSLSQNTAVVSSAYHNASTTVLNTASKDIGYYIDLEINDDMKRILLENPWEPPKNYSYPFRENMSLHPAETEISLTGETLGGIILQKLKSLGSSLDDCASIRTDGCSVMISEKRTVKEIQKEASNAVMSPYYSHKLNNVISQSSKVTIIENTVDVMKDVISFFCFPKYSTVLYQFLGHKLAQLCNTRWVERHDGLNDMMDKATAAKAKVMIAVVLETQFIVGLFCLSDVLASTLPVSKLLQKESLDLTNASETTTHLLSALEARRVDSKTHFNVLFSQIEEMARKLDIELQKPRICGCQIMQRRELQLLKIKGEASHWQQKWRSEKNRNAVLPTTAATALNKDLYSLIHTLLQILCTLPVSNVSAERSISTLRLTKTWLQSTMLEYRLIGLALLYIHYDIQVDPQHVIERFSKMGKSRMIL
ncbi:hypothetical protein PR048_016446 [Dryococelus australis]|uniref:HAT C-terminal dimerisation domain-containing protein n=1 Tax=Dryococelus australis TaxID=614101 RepID=A0ABQ9HK63_9NEOP|nr:hypothetical protein PR048_016446 [Dryococelus australis]